MRSKGVTKKFNLIDHCLFCEPWLFKQEGQILLKSDNFYLFAGLGAIVEGYIIIAPNICNDPKFPFHSFADATLELIDELVFLRGLISEYYKDCYDYGHTGMHFEHGRTGACLQELLYTKHCYHAHICCYPVSHPIWQDIKYLKVEKLNDIHELPVRAGNRNSSYLFIENCLMDESHSGGATKQDIWETHIVFLKSETDIPSQYLRRLLASRVGEEHLWDWAAFPQWNLVNKLIDNFKEWLQSKEEYWAKNVDEDDNGILRIRLLQSEVMSNKHRNDSYEKCLVNLHSN